MNPARMSMDVRCVIRKLLKDSLYVKGMKSVRFLVRKGCFSASEDEYLLKGSVWDSLSMRFWASLAEYQQSLLIGKFWPGTRRHLEILLRSHFCSDPVWMLSTVEQHEHDDSSRPDICRFGIRQLPHDFWSHEEQCTTVIVRLRRINVEFYAES